MTDTQRYFTLLTDKGKYKIAAAAANKGDVIFTHFAIGDGNGQETNPIPSQTALVHEVWRTQLDSVITDPKNPAAVIINAIVPNNVGGWWMREFGLFDIDGDMLAIVKPAANYKATSAEGQIEDIFFEFQLVLGEQAQVVVLVDPSILWATREYVQTYRMAAWQMMNTPWLPVKAANVATPPATNAMGDTYVVPQGAKAAWEGKTGQLAEWNGKAWNFTQTPDGHGIGLPDGQMLQKVGGAYWPQVALDVQSGKWLYAEAQGTANALTATLNPAPQIYSAGMSLRLKLKSANTGAATLDLNGLGAKPIIYHETGQALIGKDLQAGDVVELLFDGASWRLQPSYAKISLDSQSGQWLFAEDGGSVNALTATLTPKPTALPKQIIVLPKYDNTGAATLLLDGFAQRSILSQNGSPLVAGDLKAGTPALLALMANGNYTLTNAASAPPPGTGFAGSKTRFGWRPAGAATALLNANFTTPCIGIVMAFSTVNKSQNENDGNIKNMIKINSIVGNNDWVGGSSVSIAVQSFQSGETIMVESSVSTDKAVTVSLSQYLNYIFIPA